MDAIVCVTFDIISADSLDTAVPMDYSLVTIGAVVTSSTVTAIGGRGDFAFLGAIIRQAIPAAIHARNTGINLLFVT